MNNLAHHVKRSFFSVAFATAVVTGAGTVMNVALGSVTPVMAQDQASPAASAAPQRGHRMGQMLMSLNLNDAQKTQIRAIMADARKQNQDVTDRDTRRANMKAAMTKVETVLTPAQRTELHAKMDAMRQQDQSAHPQ